MESTDIPVSRTRKSTTRTRKPKEVQPERTVDDNRVAERDEVAPQVNNEVDKPKKTRAPRKKKEISVPDNNESANGVSELQKEDDKEETTEDEQPIPVTRTKSTKPLSEKQRAHLEKMRQIRAEKRQSTPDPIDHVEKTKDAIGYPGSFPFKLV